MEEKRICFKQTRRVDRGEENGSQTFRISYYKRSLSKTAVSEIIGPPDLSPTGLIYENNCFSIVVCTMCFIETVHDKECIDKSVEQTELDLERAGFVKNWLNSVEIIRS